MFNLAVFISGSGTNLQALIDARSQKWQISLVVSDKAEAYGIKRAEAMNIKALIIPKNQKKHLLETLREYSIDGIALAGYLSILPAEIVAAYQGKIINIHPSLIPYFCGKGFYGLRVHEAVLNSAVSITGATVHFVDAGVDTGPVIIQETVGIAPEDTAESLQKKVLPVEHSILLKAVEGLAEGRIDMNSYKKLRALVSVSDKEGIVEFAAGLLDLGYEIVSTGGTAALLVKNGIPVTPVETVTNFPECLDGRVKTLHPNIFGGILSIRSLESHCRTLEELNIRPIDIVAVNLYPFAEVIKNPAHSLEQAIENIDIGGPSMIRAAAKNYPFVTVITDKDDYNTVLSKLKDGSGDEKFRYALAVKAFEHTAAYDTMISEYLRKDTGFPEKLTLSLRKKQDLRYGENPHQLAAYYEMPESSGGRPGIEKAVFLHGKELSYNNINDAQGAVSLTYEFAEPVCVAVKHATPCGVGIGTNPYEAYCKAYESDPVSIFGGILCFNRELDAQTAEKLNDIFLEVVIAPAYTREALDWLKKKKNLRVLQLANLQTQCGKPGLGYEYKSAGCSLLIQQLDGAEIDLSIAKTVTEKEPSQLETEDLAFALKVVKHVKSNGIVVAKNGRTLGIGGGAVSRIGAARSALSQAGVEAKGAVMASDAYFPFPDVAALCGEYGISAIVQPGGSNNDLLSIEECNKQSISMLFTGMRHFKH